MRYEEGNGASFTKTISESDIYLFAGITGDMNDLHINQINAQGTTFGRRIAHGMLTGAFIYTVLGMKFPGPGTVYLEQKLEFRKPVFMGDTITAQVKVDEILNEKKGIIRLKTEVYNQNDICVIDGYAVVRIPEGSIEKQGI